MVALRFEQESAQGVSAHFCETFAEDALGEERLKGFWEGELRTTLFVTAGGCDEESRLASDSEGESLIGCGVAGVEGDDDAAFEVGERGFGGERAVGEAQIFQGVLTRQSFRGAREIFTKFDAGEFCGARGVGEVDGECEGEVGFAGTEVDDGDGTVGVRQLVQERFDAFDEAGDLSDLVAHRGGWLPLTVGEADGVEDGVA